VPIDWAHDLLGFFGAFAVGYVIFALNIMGGGDVKLIIVLALWVGLGKLADFSLNFALFGGALTIILLLLRGILPMLFHKEKLPRVLKMREPVPYGLAISAAFLMLLIGGEIPAAPLFEFSPQQSVSPQPEAQAAPQSDN
jgi:prepilin peptidase CpaA